MTILPNHLFFELALTGLQSLSGTHRTFDDALTGQ